MKEKSCLLTPVKQSCGALSGAELASGLISVKGLDL